jgi:putative oxidoreductase
MKKGFNFFTKFYFGLARLQSYLQDPLLLLIRLYWGYSFAIAGWGKLHNIDQTAHYFESLNIPFPLLNTYLASCTEFLGGICLILGLLSPLATVPLCITMLVAYFTASPDALVAFFSDPEEFTTATPFLFLYATLIVMAFGPGRFSLDYVIHLIFKKHTPASPFFDQS